MQGFFCGTSSPETSGEPGAVCFLWYLQESNQGHTDFQSVALPTELRYQYFNILFRVPPALLRLRSAQAYFGGTSNTLPILRDSARCSTPETSGS